MPCVVRMAAWRPGPRGGDGDSDSDAALGRPGFSPGETRRSRGEADSSKKALEMSWRFQKRKNHDPAFCTLCNGAGSVECSWCHATGVLMLGDRLMCSIEGQSHCLACHNGEVKCKACKGTGRLASWMVPEL